MKRLIPAVVVVFLACGPSFEGHFTGNGSVLVTCPDGSSGGNNILPDWTITEVGSDLTISSNGNCSPLTATVQGSTASLDAKTCPPQFNQQGDKLVESLDTGTLTLTQSGDLSLQAQGKATFTFLSQPGQPQLVCREVESAQLLRVK